VAADMIAVRVVGPMKAAIVATPSYFELHKKPRSPDDLQSSTVCSFAWTETAPYMHGSSSDMASGARSA